MEVDLPAEQYFRCGDVNDLRTKMDMLLEKGLSKDEREEIRKQIEEKYNPSTIFRTYPSEIRCAVTNVNFTGRAGQAGTG